MISCTQLPVGAIQYIPQERELDVSQPANREQPHPKDNNTVVVCNRLRTSMATVTFSRPVACAWDMPIKRELL